MTALADRPLPVVVAEPAVWLSSLTVPLGPADLSYRKTSVALFASAWPVTMLIALLTKTTNLPSSLTAWTGETSLSPLAVLLGRFGSRRVTVALVPLAAWRV